MDRSRVAIVIPAYNEADTIDHIVRGVFQYGTPIVVDDGSNDGTANLAREAGAFVITHTTNMGYDAALNTGFNQADKIGSQYVLTIDADGQHDASILPVFINALSQGADVVIGIRDRRQRLAEHAFAWISLILWRIRDPLCGIKGYRIGLYRELGHFDSYKSIGTELAIFAVRECKQIIQIPVATRIRVDESRFGRRINANVQILKALLCALWIRPAKVPIA